MVLEVLIQKQLLNLVQFFIVITIGIIVTKIVSEAALHFLKKTDIKKLISKMGYEEPIIEMIVMVLRYIMYFVTFIIALAQFGFALFVLNTIIILTSLFVTILIFFSLKDFIPNASAGLYLNSVKSIRKGDVLKIGNYKGRVVNMDLVNIILEDKNGRLTIIPNSNVINKEIIREYKKKNKKNIKRKKK